MTKALCIKDEGWTLDLDVPAMVPPTSGTNKGLPEASACTQASRRWLVVTLKGGLQPLRLPVGVADTVGAAARDAVSVGIRGRDDAWVVGVEVEPAAVLGGEGHVTGYAPDLRLVAADHMVRVALRVMVEGTLFVTVACRLGSGTNPALGSTGFRSSTQPTWAHRYGSRNTVFL